MDKFRNEGGISNRDFDTLYSYLIQLKIQYFSVATSFWSIFQVYLIYIYSEIVLLLKRSLQHIRSQFKGGFNLYIIIIISIRIYISVILGFS